MAKQKSGKPGDGTCLCGCGAETKPRRRFLQGHDQRLRGMFQRGEVTANTAALKAFVAENRETTKKKETKASKAATKAVLDAVSEAVGVEPAE